MAKVKTRRRATPAKANQPSQGQSQADQPSTENGAMERKPIATQNEAILTSKNFRLARELNELRVKHRDETKMVRQLTMDNRNLASRFRQALNHVESLKKELAMYKKDTLEAAAARDRDYKFTRYSANIEISTADEDLQSDGEEFLQSIVTPKHLPQDSNLTTNSIKSSGDNMPETASEVPDDKIEVSTPSPSPVTPDSDEDSPVNDDTTVENDEFGELRTEDFFHHTYESTLPATPEKENIDVEGMNKQFDSFLSVSENEVNIEKVGKVGTLSISSNSIDAFEASFQTAFPSSFADTPVSPSPTDSDFSDAFFLNTTPEDEDTDVDEPKDEIVQLFPSSAFETGMGNFESPSKDGTEEEAVRNSRYGLRERNEDLPMDEAKADEEHSPTLVLKRLQQRKARQISPAPNANDGKGNLSINEEMKKLDAIANGIGSTRERRRAVRQPVSYAEPSLNSKLRRGDVFFQKENLDDMANNSNPLKDRQTNSELR